MRLRSYFLATLRSAVALATLTTAAHAQSRATTLPSGKAFDFTPYVGYMVFGAYMTGPFGTSLGNAPAPVYGAQLGMRLAPNISVVGNIAAASSDIKAGIPILGGLSVAQSNMLIYDGGLQLDVPVLTMSGTSFTPFIQAGAGAIRYDISQSFLSTTATNFAGERRRRRRHRHRQQHRRAPDGQGLHRQVRLQGRDVHRLRGEDGEQPGVLGGVEDVVLRCGG